MPGIFRGGEGGGVPGLVTGPLPFRRGDGPKEECQGRASRQENPAGRLECCGIVGMSGAAGNVRRLVGMSEGWWECQKVGGNVRRLVGMSEGWWGFRRLVGMSEGL